MDSEGIGRAVTRISYEIIEKNKGLEDVCIIGIQRRGVALAKMLAEKIEKNENQKIDVGILDITFYRDDLSMLNEHPVLNSTDIPFSVQDKKVIEVPGFFQGYLNTIYYTVLGTLIGLTVTCLTAYPLSKQYLKGRRFFNLMFVFTMMFSGGLVASYINYRSLNILNTVWAVVLPGAISAYNMILTRTFFEQIPVSLEESAKLDGAGDLTVFAKIYLPLSIPIISTIMLFIVVGRWNSWFHEFIVLMDKAKYPVQIVIRNVVLEDEIRLSTQQAMSDQTTVTVTSLKYSIIILTMVPMLILYPFIQKYLVKGIMVGAIKG